MAEAVLKLVGERLERIEDRAEQQGPQKTEQRGREGRRHTGQGTAHALHQSLNSGVRVAGAIGEVRDQIAGRLQGVEQTDEGPEQTEGDHKAAEEGRQAEL